MLVVYDTDAYDIDFVIHLSAAAAAAVVVVVDFRSLELFQVEKGV